MNNTETVQEFVWVLAFVLVNAKTNMPDTVYIDNNHPEKANEIQAWFASQGIKAKAAALSP